MAELIPIAMSWWVLILVVGFWVIPIVIASRSPTKAEKQAAEQIKKLRNSRAAESAYVDQWGAPSKFVERVLTVVARVSEESFMAIPEKMPADRLMPDDRLSEELAYHLDELSMDVLVMRLQGEFGIRLRGRDFTNAERLATWFASWRRSTLISSALFASGPLEPQ